MCVCTFTYVQVHVLHIHTCVGGLGSTSCVFLNWLEIGSLTESLLDWQVSLLDLPVSSRSLQHRSSRLVPPGQVLRRCWG